MSSEFERYEVVMTAPAKADLRRILDYITRVLQNPQAAGALSKEMHQTLASLGTMPHRFPLVRDESFADVRWTQVKGFLVFYAVREEKQSVTVLRIASKLRDWQKLLGEPESGFSPRS